MISISVDKEPAAIKVIIFRPFFSFEDFTSSRDTAIHSTTETIATMILTPVDILETSLIDIFSGCYIPLKHPFYSSLYLMSEFDK